MKVQFLNIFLKTNHKDGNINKRSASWFEGIKNTHPERFDGNNFSGDSEEENY